ncbi:MAG: hypothetical protein ABSC21_12400 [Terriglobia bacterium]|jgi:hypothetical protein
MKRKAINRCWACIKGTRDNTDPKCVLWLSADPNNRGLDFYEFAEPGDNSLPLPNAEYLSKPVVAFTALVNPLRVSLVKPVAYLRDS